MQLLTIEDLLAGAEVKYPRMGGYQATFKKAPRSRDKLHPEAMFEDGLLADEQDPSLVHPVQGDTDVPID